ncbi:pantoate--beta-alanine ligase [Marnyiella aurantia]|uniref:Pantothenate synthetase n=1 Tax=Marnyiella aurantia TaxID=2758037 RepID=A0A7D7LM45_9FLAO|nr:pantoate--beta-alanine ligase [Marnyiella aurantia]MBA5246510.1 pantoate--beta-alanine ligase [Marnyiella aurantia]QMS98124.1 pantoate--beta-alanine ligase [Marnyiella aurantia]
MEIFRNKAALVAFVERNREMGKVIGFAPTMGALHEGHIALYESASAENDLIISSIFVNPTQFNNPEDLTKYPRTIEADLEKLQDSGVVHAVYLPEAVDIYPEGIKSKHYSFDGLEDQMEGASRPGHFDGVGTVVEELLRQVQPDNAYFGEKDYQQLAIVKNLVKQKNLPVTVKGIPTQRLENGLARSSRNSRLTPEQREAATVLYETLLKVNDWFRVVSVPEINNRVTEIFNSTPGMVMEYFIIADEETLKETDFFYKDRSYRAFLVVFVGNVRLIDNLHLD